jgi:hypothetical protein
MSSPVTNWEGVGAYFTFADKPLILGVLFALAVGLTVFAIWSTVRHEQHSYNNPMEK